MITCNEQQNMKHELLDYSKKLMGVNTLVRYKLYPSFIFMEDVMKLLHLIGVAIRSLIVLSICLSLLFVCYKGNQPMSVDQAPKGMTYFDFMSDRFHAAQSVKPTRCGWGMMLSLAALGPVYSLDYTWVATHPNGFLAKVTAPDPDIPQNVAGANWYEIPEIWWTVVERLSWTMLAKHHPGCYLGPILTRSYALSSLS